MGRSLRMRSFLACVACVAAVAVLGRPAPAVAAPCDEPVANPVACENTRPGNPASEWDVSGAGSTSIQGFATDMSVDQGATSRLPRSRRP